MKKRWERAFSALLTSIGTILQGDRTASGPVTLCPTIYRKRFGLLRILGFHGEF